MLHHTPPPARRAPYMGAFMEISSTLKAEPYWRRAGKRKAGAESGIPRGHFPLRYAFAQTRAFGAEIPPLHSAGVSCYTIGQDKKSWYGFCGTQSQYRAPRESTTMEMEISVGDLLEGLDASQILAAPPPSKKGMPANHLEVEWIRELTAKDLFLPPDASQCAPQAIKSLRARHHELAKSIARGEDTYTAIGKVHGYSVCRISTLMTDPAFLDLVENYRSEVDAIYREELGAQFRSTQERLVDIVTEASDMLLERLDETPDGFTNNQLLEMVKTAADRTGDGVTSTQRVEQSVVVASAEGIALIKSRVQGRQNGQAKRINQEIIEVEGEDVTDGRESADLLSTTPQDERATDAARKLVSTDRRAPRRADTGRNSGAVVETCEAEGRAGEGEEL